MKKKIYWLALIFFIIDLISKQVVVKLIGLHESVKVIPNFFYLTYVQNEGAAFSIFQDQQILILLITVIALVLINKYLNNEKMPRIEGFSMAMITGGIFGNLFDRLAFGYVIDFFDFRFGKFNYPIFNMADIFIVVGVVMLAIYSFGDWRKEHGSKSFRTRKSSN